MRTISIAVITEFYLIDSLKDLCRCALDDLVGDSWYASCLFFPLPLSMYTLRTSFA